MTATTISDTERREVARRLRELHPEDRCWFGIHGFDWFMFADSLFDAIGCNGIRNWTDYLADLVEPSETIHVDRQKLIEVANWLVKHSDEFSDTTAIRNVAHSIYSALGKD